ECANPPAALVRRLADEPVAIAAPVLLRSNALTDIDLIALIGRHGVGHARVVGRRPGLNPTIALLVGALLKSARRPPPTADSRAMPVADNQKEAMNNAMPA